VSDDHLSPVAIRIAVALVALLAVGVVVTSLVLTSGDEPDTSGASSANSSASSATAAPRTGPVVLVDVDAPDARSASCTGLMKALPDTLPDSGKTLHRLPIAEPAPPSATAWGGDRGEPVVLRCGLPRPAELTPTAALREISGVRWLPLEGDGATTWVVVDRPVYVVLTVPAGSGTGPLQEVSATTGEALPVTPVRVR
jgi:hypothetical protein